MANSNPPAVMTGISGSTGLIAFLTIVDWHKAMIDVSNTSVQLYKTLGLTPKRILTPSVGQDSFYKTGSETVPAPVNSLLEHSVFPALGIKD